MKTSFILWFIGAMGCASPTLAKTNLLDMGNDLKIESLNVADLTQVTVELPTIDDGKGGVQEYSAAIYEVMEGINDVKKLLQVQKSVPVHKVTMEDQMDQFASVTMMLQKAVQDLQKAPESEMASVEIQMLMQEVSHELENAQKVAIDVKEATIKASAQRRLTDEGASYNGGTGSRGASLSSMIPKKYRSHPKLRQHFKIHDKIVKGDHTHLDHMLERLTPRSTMHGRRLGNSTAETMEETCEKTVSCVKEFSLYDFVAHFYGDYVNDEGKIDEKKVSKHMSKKVSSSFDFFTKLESVRDAVKAIDDNGLNQSNCVTFLREMHQSEMVELKEKTYYEQYKGPTWREICSAEGTAKYIKLEDIKVHVGSNVAYHLFEDMSLCAQTLGDPVLFDNKGLARVPIKPKVNSNAASDLKNFDKYGQPNFPIQVESFFEFATIDIFNNEYFEGKCYNKTNEYFKEILENSSFNITNTGALKRTYPEKIVWDCDNMGSKGVPSGYNNWDCTVEIGDKDICGKVSFVNKVHPSTGKGDGTGVKTEEIKSSIYEKGTFNMDEAVTLLLGPKTSVGLVCAYAETKKDTPGYCCLDHPWEREGDLFGTSFECRETESACKHVAQGLGGFSKESCAVYSGTYCSKPTDCSLLKQCVADEVQWAKENGKTTYQGFLETAPDLDDTTSVDECGTFKEYFGAESRDPDLYGVCEDIQYLRYNTNFDDLDANKPAELKEVPKGIGLEQPGEPQNGDDYFNTWIHSIVLLETIASTFSKVWEVIKPSKVTCETSPVGLGYCFAFWYVLTIIAFLAYFAGEQALALANWQYGNAQISDRDMYVILENTKVLFKNLETVDKNAADRAKGLQNNLSTIQTEVHTKMDKVQTELAAVYKLIKSSTSGSRRKLETSLLETDMIEGLDDIDTQEVYVPPSLGWAKDQVTGQLSVPGKVFQSSDQAIQFLHNSLHLQEDGTKLDITEVDVSSCEAVFEVLPIKEESVGNTETVKIAVDSKAPAVSCGFSLDSSVASVSNHGKTLLLSEQGAGGLLDSSFSYTVQDDCSKSVDVDVTVVTNQWDDKTSCVLVESDSNQAKILIAPKTCKSRDSLCYSSSGTSERLYEIHVTATDASGLVGRDTCHIAVLPSDGVEHKEALSSMKTSVRGAGSDKVAELLALPAAAEKFKVGSLQVTKEGESF
ncbi:expressed unknown protein [Seminavis robusta]|uniref:Uncharacterized protein n=1 Tax=Seminavis robusta TaxID=568900 RepID=A0A9N8EIZ2_9STRA|nr:expressed unknown protein [Seminavis robusta]|eukprot:Sro1214_g253040.1 n/a (1177) ;mRNA; f:15771-20351